MTTREKLYHLAIVLITVVTSILAARYGIPIPPPIVQPPIINLPPTPLPPSGSPDIQPGGAPNPEGAIVRLSFKGVGCSATIIGPRRQDGRWWVLTASHCVESIGQHGTIRLLDGRITGVTVQSFDRRPDCCWMVTEANSETFPYALLAKEAPPVGTKIWHAGYGVDKPGNREEGSVTALPDSNGQIRMKLSVSSGDSGGGIMMNEKGEVVSCVCCTTSKGQLADVWGCSPESAQRTKPTTMVLDDWVPLEIPQRMPPK